MFFRKLARKILKDERHIGITLYPTSKCDTGCAHCIDDSTCKNPIHFKKELAEKIVKEARRERWQLSVLLTGGGEPLMTHDLLGITDVFGNYERLGIFGMITSGFLNRETERKTQFENLLKRGYMKNFSIDQSFSLYHESFPERLANTATLMMQNQEISAFRIRAAMSLENCKQTKLKIEDVLKKLAEKIDGKSFALPIGFHESDRRLFHLFENTIIGGAQTYKLFTEAVLMTSWHAIKTKKGGTVINVMPIPFEQIGRGSSINQTSFSKSVCYTLGVDFEDTYLIVTPSGDVFADCSCTSSDHMRLGNIGKDSLVDLIARKDVFSKKITQALLADSRHCQWGTKEACELCKQIVFEKGISL
ncbi:MAG: hypothetical protein WCI36_05305 [bacterium]